MLDDTRSWSVDQTYCGVGYNWFGWAWAWLALVRHGLVPDRPSLRRTIARRLRRRPRFLRGFVGGMIGAGAGPVVAAGLVSIAPSERPLLVEQVRSWIAVCRRDHRRDLLGGSSGALLAAAEIEALCPGSIPPAFVARIADEVAVELVRWTSPGARAFLGLSHGVAGLLLGLEAARAVFGVALPREHRARAIDVLMDERLRGPRNIANWPRSRDDARIVGNAWCHGAAGIALAAACGHRLSADAAYERLLDCALPSAVVLAGNTLPNFCCGMTGQSQIFIEGYRISGERRWLRGAERIARQVRDWQPGDRSFLRGRLGAKYLALRLRFPDELPLPGLGSLSV